MIDSCMFQKEQATAVHVRSGHVPLSKLSSDAPQSQFYKQLAGWTARKPDSSLLGR